MKDPQTIQRIERALLGSVLVLGRTPKATVKETDFAAESHRAVWRAILSLLAEGFPVDLVMVGWHLDRLGLLEKAGGWGYVASLVDDLPDVENLNGYAEAVKFEAVERVLSARKARTR